MFSAFSRRVRILVVSFLFSVLFLGMITPAYAQQYGFILAWGSQGYDDGQFDGPRGVAVDASGDVYVTDDYNCRVQKFTSSGSFILAWGGHGQGDGQFDHPSGVAVDGEGNVYVADCLNQRVQKFTSSGSFILKWGTRGSGDGQFYNPHGVDVDNEGNVYVADSFNYRVQKFTSSGSFILKWGSQGEGDGQFNPADDVAVDSEGNVYVADTINNRIQKFTSSGDFILKWGSYGFSNGQFYYPHVVAVDSGGSVYVSEDRNDRVQKFNGSGSFIVAWGGRGAGDGKFWSPCGVAVDASGDVYVADYYNYRVQEFGFGPVYTLTISSTGDGTTDQPPGSYIYAADAMVVVSVSATPIQPDPNPPYVVLDHWELDGVNVGSANPYSVTMDQNHSLHAVFSSPQGPPYLLTIYVAGSGTTDPAPGTHTYDEGASVSVYAIPDSGWMLDHWALDGSDVGSTDPLILTMNAHHTLTAVFTVVPGMPEFPGVDISLLGATLAFLAVLYPALRRRRQPADNSKA